VTADPLAPLFAPLTSLRGVGDAVARLISRAVGGERVIDLLFHLPESYIDRRERGTIRSALPGRLATLEVEVVRIESPTSSRAPTRVAVTDGTGFVELIFFHRFPAAKLPAGAKVIVSG
jgi:ATP-dependent DNA helicase RecG